MKSFRRPHWISPHAVADDFPPLEQALAQPDGLLAIGGDLSTARLMAAYRRGIFPWYSDDQPILWWSPSQRLVLFPENLKVSRSLRKTLRKALFTVTLNRDFYGVITGCAAPRPYEAGTWITPEMQQAYCRLHQDKLAHSVETWCEGQLVGGLYGVVLGKVFFGESMFSRMDDASKVALVYLVRQLWHWGFELIDCQVYTHHLHSLGAVEIPRRLFRELLDHLCVAPSYSGTWQFDTMPKESYE